MGDITPKKRKLKNASLRILETGACMDQADILVAIEAHVAKKEAERTKLRTERTAAAIAVANEELVQEPRKKRYSSSTKKSKPVDVASRVARDSSVLATVSCSTSFDYSPLNRHVRSVGMFVVPRQSPTLPIHPRDLDRKISLGLTSFYLLCDFCCWRCLPSLFAVDFIFIHSYLVDFSLLVASKIPPFPLKIVCSTRSLSSVFNQPAFELRCSNWTVSRFRSVHPRVGKFGSMSLRDATLKKSPQIFTSLAAFENHSTLSSLDRQGFMYTVHVGRIHIRRDVKHRFLSNCPIS